MVAESDPEQFLMSKGHFLCVYDTEAGEGQPT